MKMTKVNALNAALTAMTADYYEYRREDGCIVHVDTTGAKELITNMIAQISKPRAISEEAKAQANAKRKEQNAKVRGALMEKVLPVLREGLTHTQIGLTAKEIYDVTKDNLPEDFTAHKVQYILLHELANEVEKIETKNKPNLYRLKEM